MDKERLLKMADWLDTLPPEGYDMRRWRTCAIGHSARAELFPGLSVIRESKLDFTHVNYEGETSLRGVMRLFSISLDDCGHLFGSHNVADKPQDTAKHIREFTSQ